MLASSYKLELARFSTLLIIQDRAEYSKCTELLLGEGTPHRKKYILEVGGTPHIPYEVGTPHVPY